MKRVTLKPKCPNPLFEQWLEEYRVAAAEKGSDMQYCFGKALQTLRKYPLPLKSGKECAVLEFFGDRLCHLLDHKLSEYRKTHPEVDLVNEYNVDDPAENDDMEGAVPPKRKRTKKDSKENGGKTLQSPRVKEYVPAWRSGPYAILITLLCHEKTPGSAGFMTKSDLQLKAQPLCDASFTRPDPGSHYTAWSSMSQLIKKGLAHKYSNPAKFNLTDDGRKLAERLSETDKSRGDNHGPLEPVPQTISKPTLPTSQNSKESFKRSASASSSFEDCGLTMGAEKYQTSTDVSKPSCSFSSSVKDNHRNHLLNNPAEESENCGDIVLEPDTFDIILLVDTAETTGGPRKKHDQTLAELSEMKVPFEVRRLAVGDFIWIARSKKCGAELVLPYVVERKRMDDFGGSIKDGRFREQKFRLKQSGIQNLIYLVESYGSDQHVGLPLTTLQQAAVNIQVVHGFFVKHSPDHRNSMAYLASLTSILGRSYLNKTLIACRKEDLSTNSIEDEFVMLMNFKEFYKASWKVRKFLVKEMFIRHLLQMKGLSVEKALAIVKHYPTPLALISVLQKNDENPLSTVLCGPKNRNLGPGIIKAVTQLYSKEKLT